MSINRPKRVTFRANRDSSSSFLDENKQNKPLVWSEAVANKPEEAFKPYSVKTVYTPGDLLRHPKFGPGVVVGVEQQKIDVMFEDGTKKLAHAMG